MLKTTLLGILLFGIGISLIAQSNTDYMKIHNLQRGFTAEAYHSIETHRDGYILTGWNASPDTISGGPFLETLNYTIIDSSLNVIKNHIFKEPGVINFAIELLRFNEQLDTYVFVGRTNQGTPSGRRRQLVTAVTADLDTLWQYQHEDPRTYTSDFPLGAFLSVDSSSIWVYGDYRLVAPLYENANNFDSLGLTYAWFREISLDGQLIRGFDYSYDSIRYSTPIATIPVGDSLICTSLFVPALAPQNDSCAITCFYLNNLQEKFAVMLPGMERQGEQNMANDIILNKNQTEILVPTYGDTIHTGSWDGPYRWRPEYYAVSLDDGEITPLWKQTVENYYLLWSLNSRANGDILSTGQRHVGNTTHLSATLTNRDGNDLSVIWERNYTFSDTYSYPSNDWFIDEAMELPSGEILAIGSVAIDLNEGQDDIRGLILKLDSLGCPYANCGQDTVIYLDADVRTSSSTGSELQPRAKFFNLLNTASQSKAIEVDLFKGIGTADAFFVLTDNVGREVYRWSASQGTYSLQTLPFYLSQGSYQVSFMRSHEVLQTERFVILE